MSAYTAPSQIAERQLEYFTNRNLLIAGEAEDLFPLKLAEHAASVSIFTTHFAYHSKFDNQSKINSIFSEELVGEIDADMLLFYWPKAKAEAEYLLAMIMAKLGPNTEVVVVGENRSGVKSIEKMFKPYGQIKKMDSARRCSFYWGECSEPVQPFVLSEWFKTYSVEAAEQQLLVKSLPGVFSHGELDVGTKLLLASLPKLNGKTLDIGCGAGVIGAALAIRNPSIELEMCDVSALAIASTKETLKANNLSARVFASDVFSNADNNYQTIVSNPPFHSGLDTSYSATETLLAEAPNQLLKSGNLYIVANGFLKYSPIIERAFGHCNRISKTTKFAVYQAEK